MTFKLKNTIMSVSGLGNAHKISQNGLVVFIMPEKNRITIYDVAKKAGVSRQTVSRVLNNRQDVSEDTRKRIQDIIEEINYHPNAIAQSLSRQKSCLFGVVTAGLKYIGPSRTLSGITSKAEELGYGLLLKELAQFSSNDVQSLLHWFQSHQVEGIIWAIPEVCDNHNWLDSLLPGLDTPILFLSISQRDKVQIVSVDNYQGARAATQLLIDQGKKHIAHIAGPGEWWEAQQRRAGWSDALSEEGFSVEVEMCVEGNWSSRSGKAAYTDLSEQYSQMDAVFVANDQMALGVLQSTAEQGLRIPDDLMVIGFDGIPESEFFSPSLTTVYQDQNMLGSIAVEELAKMVENDQSKEGNEPPTHIILQPELILRQSTGEYPGQI